MKTSIIPIFIPHYGCPYRCIFCNQWRITGHRELPVVTEIADQIMTYQASATTGRHWELAYYGGSFTALPMDLQKNFLEPAYAALQAGRLDAIRLSTRPDCITIPILEQLRRYGVTIVELGVQSMDDAVLAVAKRGHVAAQVYEAVTLLRQYGFTVGLQLMPGLPGEDMSSLWRTTIAIGRLQPDFTRIYPVVVIDDTELAELYQNGGYTPLTIAEGVRRATVMKQYFLYRNIPVIRTGLQATAELDEGAHILGGAYHPAMGEMVDTRRYAKQIIKALRRVHCHEPIMITYNRRDTSKVRGIRNVTIHRLQRRYPYLRWQEGIIAVGAVSIVQQGMKQIITCNTWSRA